MMVNRDCIMANLEQRDCKGLKELYCAKEDSLAHSISRWINTIEMAAGRKKYVEGNEERR